MTPRLANTLTAVGLAGLLAGVALTAPRWAGALRASPVPIEGEEAAPEPSVVAPEAPAATGRRIAVRLYFEGAEHGGLVPEEREIAFSSDLAQQLRTVVEELARGPADTRLVATLPAGTRVLDVFVHGRGVVYVNLSGEARAGSSGGSQDELLTVYSLVDTIASNFPAAARVQILVDDRAVESLAGHVDLSRPLLPDMSLVSLEPLPDPGASPSPGVSPSPAASASPAAGSQ